MKEKNENKSLLLAYKAIKKSNITTLVCIILVIGIIMSIISKSFFSILNINVITQTFTILAIAGISQMIIISTGGMNLTVGAIGGFSGVITGGAMEMLKIPIIYSVLLGMLAGLLCGLMTAFFVTRNGSTGAASFLVTLAMSYVFTGITVGVTNGNPYYNLFQEFKDFGHKNLFGLPYIFYVMIIVAIIVSIIFRYLGLGKQMLAIGNNPHAASLYGISINKTLYFAYMLSGLLASVAGILAVTRIGSAQPTIGEDWMIVSFAAPIIGGTALAGGRVNTFGTVLGALILSMIANCLVALSIDAYWLTFVQGLVIFLAVATDKIRTSTKNSGGM